MGRAIHPMGWGEMGRSFLPPSGFHQILIERESSVAHGLKRESPLWHMGLRVFIKNQHGLFKQPRGITERDFSLRKNRR